MPFVLLDNLSLCGSSHTALDAATHEQEEGVRMVGGDEDINTVGVVIVAVVGRERHEVTVMVGG